MRKNLIVLILLIGLTACTSLIPATDSPSTPADTGEPIEETAAETLTPAPRPTATGTDIPLTPTPSLTATFTPYPTPAGLLTHEELEQRMQDWISGEIEFTDADRWLDQENGRPIRLGIFDKTRDQVMFVFFSLGFGLVEDQQGNSYLINLAGFEDAEGNRFTTVLGNGRLDDQEAIIRLFKWQGRRIGQDERLSFELLPPEEFVDICTGLPISVFGGITFIGDRSSGNEAWSNYLAAAEGTTEALTDFLLCEDCTIEKMPAILDTIINTIPEEFVSDIPYIFEYHVAYW